LENASEPANSRAAANLEPGEPVLATFTTAKTSISSLKPLNDCAPLESIGPPHKTREHATTAIELAREVGDLSIEFWARWTLAVLSGMSGANDDMAAAIDELNDLAARWRSPVLRLWSADLTIELAWGRGDWDAGTALGEQAITLARNLNQRTLLPRLLVWTSLFYVGRGQLEQAQALVDESVEISGLGKEEGHIDVHQVVPAYIGLAHYLLALGEYKQAIAAAENGLRIAEGTEYVLWAIHRVLPVLGEAYLWAGEIDRAEAVSVRMREHARGLDHKLGFCWADAIDAMVCWKRGDPKSAIDLMRQAAEALEEIPMIPDAARIRRQLAGRLAEIDRPEDSAEELKRFYDIFLKL
jgi:tetratricopeptide (TPR) repeat protein